jgi:type I restriction enzyme S subunit
MKQTEIKNKIPPDWVEIELGKLVDEKRPVSYGIVQTGEPVEGGIPCIRVTDIIDGKIDTSNLITTSQKISDGYKRTMLKKGDLVMALRGKIGQIAKIGDELVGANLTRGVALIALKENYCNDFILQQISSDRTIKVFERSLNGSALQELSIGVVRKIPIILPKSLTEQQSIAKILKSCDAVIEATEKLIAQKELRKKWLMQQLLSGKQRLNGFGGEWEDIELGELLDYEQPTKYLVSDTLYDDSYSTPVLTAGKTFILGYTNEEHGICNDVPVVIFDDFTTASKYVDFHFKAKSSAMKLLRPKPNVNLKYVFEAMQLINYTVGGHERHWISKFVYLTVPCPPIEEQNAIAQVLQAADKESSLLKAKTEKLREQKKGLMQQLLTGKIRVK